jgi:hypothetical protein
MDDFIIVALLAPKESPISPKCLVSGEGSFSLYEGR